MAYQKKQGPHGNTGKVCSPEKRAVLSAKIKGTKRGLCPQGRKEAISLAKKSNPPTAKQIAAWENQKGKPGHEPWNKGKKLGPLPEVVRAKISKGGKGKPQSEHKRRAISDARKGMKFSEEHKAKLSDSAQVRAAKQIFPHYVSKLEQSIAPILIPLGFLPQFRLGFRSRPFDYGNKETKTLIEVNGCYWHGHGCSIPSIVGSENSRLRDKAAEQFANDRDYRVIWLWECGKDNWIKTLELQGVIPVQAEQVA